MLFDDSQNHHNNKNNNSSNDNNQIMVNNDAVTDCVCVRSMRLIVAARATVLRPRARPNESTQKKDPKARQDNKKTKKAEGEMKTYSTVKAEAGHRNCFHFFGFFALAASVCVARLLIAAPTVIDPNFGGFCASFSFSASL